MYGIWVSPLFQDTELGLQPHHEQTVKEYLRFTRYKRSECLRCIKSSYNSISESHLIEDNTFTSQEVYTPLTINPFIEPLVH